MKQMIVLTAALLLLSRAHSQIALGIKAGANISNVTPLTTPFTGTQGDPTYVLAYHENVAYEQNKPVNGLYAGLVARLKLGGQLTLRTGLQWVEKGWLHHSYNNFEVYSPPVRLYATDLMNVKDFKYTIHFIELPVDLEYTTPVGPGKAFIAAGPFLSYGVAGNINGHEYTLPGNTHTYDTTYSRPFFNNTGAYYGGTTTRLYWGVNGVIGYEFAMGLFLNVEYELNLTADQNEKLNVFLFGIGYMFKK